MKIHISTYICLIVMKKQVYFSFVLAILSFITMKKIEKAGIERYHFVQSPVFQKEFGWFNLNEPEFVSSLPYELREVSAVTSHGLDQVACVQDEDGIIFVYDLLSNSIVDQINFSGPGDYEGLAKVDSIFYVLRSDAQLFKLYRQADSVIVNDSRLNITSQDNESLCYDARNKRMLLTPKSKLGSGPEFRGNRAVYEIDIESGKLNQTPVFTIEVEDLKNYALLNNIPLPRKEVNLLTDSIDYYLKFKPSAIAVHPKTDEIYIISAVDRTLAVFDKSGNIMNFITLDPVLFNKPEGLTFLSNGDLVVTNEGQMGTPTLLKFNWHIGGRN